MFQLTDKLVAHAKKEWALPEDFTIEKNESEIKAFFAKALGEGTISFDDLNGFEPDPAPVAVADPPAKKDAQAILSETIAAANAPVLESLKGLGASLEKAFSGNAGGDGTTATPAPVNDPPTQPVKEAEPKEGKFSKVYNNAWGGTVNEEVRVRVKGVHEGFSHTKSYLPKQEKSMTVPCGEGGSLRQFDGISELDKAVTGATLKWVTSRACEKHGMPCPHWAKMTELDTRLMEYAAHEMPWSGPIGLADSDSEHAKGGFVESSRLADYQVKMVLDGATSGGLEAVPIVFDDIAVLTPVLNGQLAPKVTMRTTTRRRVEGFKVGNPTWYWEGEGAVPTEFSTAGFISAFDTNVFPCVGWMELGLDFTADSPVAIADIIIGNYAETGAAQLDSVIATGNGTSQPLGLTNTPGATAVPSINGNTGPLTPNDFENLLFGIPLEFRQEGTPTFVVNDVSYRRGRTIPVGTGDARRVYGERSLQDYAIAGVDAAINHGITNVTLMCAMLNRYILYRRQGFEVRRSVEGQDLMKKNAELLVVRMRYGGQMNHGSALTLMTDGMT